jgi:hypothetical protein
MVSLSLSKKNIKKIIQTGQSCLLQTPLLVINDHKFLLFWDITQCGMVAIYRPILNGHAVFLEFLARDDGTDRLPQNARK